MIKSKDMLTAKIECPRCQGKGSLKEFSHVMNGVCFMCGGHKTIDWTKKFKTSQAIYLFFIKSANGDQILHITNIKPEFFASKNSDNTITNKGYCITYGETKNEWCKTYYVNKMSDTEKQNLRLLYKYLKENGAIEVKDIK